ncbi:hypothetical protein [Litoribacillus peritrichatus]|uniref:Tetratricopeptide repeat protein n=1 Tax=Litoribacillus peritrichatus TaxID=718191 RepID=A0ABP7MSN2_9GAMM
MSLINDVLQDLDKQPNSNDQSILGVLQSAEPKVKRSGVNKALILLLVLLAAITLAASYFVYQDLYGHQASSITLSQSELASTQAEVAQSKETQPTLQHEENKKAKAVVLGKSEPSASSKASVGSMSTGAKSQSNASEADITQVDQTQKVVQQTSKDKGTAEQAGITHSNIERAISREKAIQREEVAHQKEPAQQKATVHQKDTAPQGVTATNAPEVSDTSTQVANAQSAKTRSVNTRSVNTETAEKATLNAPKKIDSAVNTSLTHDHGGASAKVEAGKVSRFKSETVRQYEAALTAFQSEDFQRSEALVDGLLVSGFDPKYAALKARILLQRSPEALVQYIDQEKLDIAASDELLAICANAFQRSGDHVRSVKSYDLLVQRQPTEGRWWLAMAYSLEAVQLKEKAHKAYQLALQAGSLPANARGYAVVQANRLDKELAELAKKAKEQE